MPATEQTIGADLGLKNFVILSTGETVGNPKFFTKDEKKLAKAQRRHAKKHKGSRNRAKAAKKVARIHASIADRRRDFLHKLSTRLIRENQTICVETLAVKNMVKNPKLSKAIHDVGWSTFVSQLAYKAEWYGRNLVKIDKWYPSSKRCFACGHLLDSLALDIRQWTCPECSVVHDRDLNAARNIHAAGLAVLEGFGEAIDLDGRKLALASLREAANPTREGGNPLPFQAWVGGQLCFFLPENFIGCLRLTALEDAIECVPEFSHLPVPEVNLLFMRFISSPGSRYVTGRTSLKPSFRNRSCISSSVFCKYRPMINISVFLSGCRGAIFNWCGSRLIVFKVVFSFIYPD